MRGIEPPTSSLPRKRSTPELHRLHMQRPVERNSANKNIKYERETRLEPATLSLEG